MTIRILIFTICLFTLLTTTFTQSDKDGINTILDTMDHKSTKEIFKAFHYLHKKTSHYKLNSMEGLNKYKTFKKNLDWIKSENKKLNKEIYGITKFTDLTKEEFAQKYLLPPKIFKNKKNSENIFSSSSLSSSLFLQDDQKDEDDMKIMQYKNSLRLLQFQFQNEENFEHKMPKIKNQEENNASWAFAAISVIESEMIKADYEKKFSEKFLMSCIDSDENINNDNSDIFNNTFNWIIKNGIIEENNFDGDFNFDKKEICQKNSNKQNQYKIVEKINFFNNENGDKNISEWYKLLKKGPIVAAIDAQFEEFMFYRPKNFDAIVPKDSNKCGKEVNHAVVVIGRKFENGKEYLIVRNSFGINWGFKGNFKIPAEIACGIFTYAFSPEINIIKSRIPKNNNTNTNTNNNYFPTFAINEESEKNSKNKFDKVFSVFTEENCKGNREIINKNNSIRVNHSKSYALHKQKTRGCVTFFMETCLKGVNEFQICEDIEDLKDSNKLKSIKSLIIDNDNIAKIDFYEKPDFLGKTYGLSADYLFNIENNKELVDQLGNTKSIKIFMK